jgi:hypothetical protein
MKPSSLIASDANTWANCTGSVQLCAMHPRIESPDGMSESRREGLAIHAVAKKMLLSYKDQNTGVVLKSDVVGTISAEGVLITDELFEYANEYVSEVLSVCNGSVSKMQIEQHVDLSWIYPDMYGYIDASLMCEKTATLYVWEGKFGHRHIPAFEDYQLLSYVCGLLEKMGVNGVHDRHLTVSMRVFQPRSFHGTGPLDEWRVMASDLRALFNILKDRAHEAKSEKAFCKTGPWCGGCSGRYACQTLQQSAYTVVDYIGDIEGVSLSGNDLSLELRILKRASELIKARLGGLEEQALAELRGGAVLPGWVAEAGYGRRRWKKDTPTDEVIMMGDLLGQDLRKPVELDTPAQAIKKGIDESVITLYSETPMTGFKLVADSGTKARNVFGKK